MQVKFKIKFFKNIRDRIKKYSLENHIDIKKHVSEKEKRKLFIKSNIFILLSENINNKFEGFGLVYLEALSYGLPVVISSDSGASDLNINKFTGLISKPNNFDKISKFIINLSLIKFYKISNECIKLCKENLWSKKIKSITTLLLKVKSLF